ncbi:forkhead-associated domain-containing protein 1-like [Porites lutea]|uniref:forkhead-associated domain-containing protein 1-like n=1 Tax=Porites lutea TaxID=51062 RepID=UPI003CC6DB21
MSNFEKEEYLLMVTKVQQMNDRMERKVQLLGSYEDDLEHLRNSETVAGQKTAEATGLKMDVRNRQEETAYLRALMSRLRDDLDQQRRLNVCLKERKEELKKKKAAEKLKRKNYEIESLKKELMSADRELNETAVNLQLLRVQQSSKCRLFNKGVMWSELRAPVIIRAVVF